MSYGRAAVASVERRVGEVETLLEEYWCKWTDDSISFSQTNWIPTNLPARTVWCFVSFTSTNDAPYIALPNFAPAADHTIHLVVNKPSGSPGFYIVSEAGHNLAWSTTSSLQVRDVALEYRRNVGWYVVNRTMPTSPYTIINGVRQTIQSSRLPEDWRFLPTTTP